MTTETHKTTDESELRETVENFIGAIRSKDLNAVMSMYAPDVVWFDFMAPLRHAGADEYKNLWEQCFAAYQGPIGIETRDLSISLGDSVAFSHSLNRMSGTFENGQKLDFWFRWTACFRKIHGRWMIAHEHVSIPFDLETNKALWELKP
jgi:uncharacterized protein (TIGR02246 family)